jgi:hypothetical protein
MMTDQDLSGRTLQTPRIGYRIDIDNPPYIELRELLQRAFRPDTLADFCRDDPQFRALLAKFGSKASLLDMIREVFDHCSVFQLWEELLDGIAEHAPRQYNHTAAQMGWPLVAEPAKPASRIKSTGPSSTDGSHSVPKASLPAAYDDVEIHVTPGPGDQYLVTLQTALAGDASDPLDKNWSDEDLSSWLTQLERGQVDGDTLAAIGKQLFRALFHDHVRDSYAQARGATRTGLRLRLRFDAPELQALPWELLWDAGPRHEFLALSGKIWITRYLSVPYGTPPLAVEPPLGVFIVTASPKDQPGIDVDAEEVAIRDALAPLETAALVRVESLAHAQMETLREALRDMQPHILHFVGHGAMRPEGGVLLLEDEDGLSRVLPADDLRLMLQYTPTVQLAVLNACATAQGAADVPRFDAQRSAVLGVGPELVRAGLGAVVAFQFSFSDVSARLFAQDFYKTLARLEPADLAVARARELLRLKMGMHSRDWATPVLFLRAPDGVIFAPTTLHAQPESRPTGGQVSHHNSTLPTVPPDQESTQRALRMARRTLAILEEQAAAYTSLTIPAHLRIELEEQRSKVAELEAKLQ